jgi:type I restriction enzyme S subunit
MKISGNWEYEYMNNLKFVTLQEVSESVRYGYTASSVDYKVGPKFLRITDIVRSHIDWDSVPYCVIEEKNFNKYNLINGDIVIARTGATVGSAKIIRKNNPKSVFASYLVRIRVDKKKVNPFYVGKIIESNIFKKFVLSRIGGAAQPNANAKVLTSFKFPIPKKTIQEHIANILSNYDDLIDINQRRIQLLEEAARLLYREWFVYFRFPGHENVKIVDGIPEGWRKEDLSGVVNFLGGYPFKSKLYQKNGKYGIVTIKNVQQGKFVSECTDYLNEIPNKMKKHCFLKKGDILISLTGNVGRVCLVYGGNYLLNQRVAKIEPKSKVFKSFIYWMFDNSIIQKKIENLSYGAAQQNLSPIKLGKLKVILPTQKFINLFDDIANFINNEIVQLYIQNQKLAQARDLLLPRLMSGKIDVSEFDKGSIPVESEV